MTPKNATAHDKAVEALIAASLRAPNKETEVTNDEINRYVDQSVTLSSEDKAALEETKPGVMQAIKDILLGNGQESNVPTVRPAKAEPQGQPESVQSGNTRNEFVEAILIAQITREIASPEFPLGHLRQNKMVYFAHRKADEDVGEYFLKKAAGPYSPWATYQGPEKIAQENGYVKKAQSGKFFGFVAGDNIDKIDRYVSRYPVCAAVDWVVDTFRYCNKEKLELFATVDFAALELAQNGKAVTMNNVKDIIATSKEWTAKLKREIFSDDNITQALVELRNLFPRSYP
jgi:hypothetical protein